MAGTRYQFERLNKNHDRAGFHCGVESLDRYFREQVSQDLRRNMTVPYILVDTADPGSVVGYYTLSSL